MTLVINCKFQTYNKLHINITQVDSQSMYSYKAISMSNYILICSCIF
jgi:hypothetical protein